LRGELMSTNAVARLHALLVDEARPEDLRRALVDVLAAARATRPPPRSGRRCSRCTCSTSGDGALRDAARVAAWLAGTARGAALRRGDGLGGEARAQGVRARGRAG